ncbi:Rap1a/Tai family immunity protein [Salmonella enterica subsp. enterica serovar Altona]|uniref:Rap1a/Tai family immunity protein n=1 Tax=Salmonella enterica TaxID=28901 RepID=UPI001D301D81|nr:virulence protein [Salmonella enterica]EHW2346677.1 virulence protein [Salmonella enterica subsp. enterica serovar Altona]EIX8652983.1 virulence protein [Salmonella enterica]EIZ5198483.1 virulence protein [Salmonella enterica]ELB6623044.1 virulence protein [Salmonella enterica]
MMKKSTYDVSHHSAVCGVTGDYYRISATYHIKRSIRVFLIILCCLLPGGVFAGSLINAGFISPDNVNLSTQDFLKFYAIDNVQKKDNTLMYMLGVADATENKLWCGYDLFKTLTLNELVYVSLKNKTNEELNSRAAELIINKLIEYPCNI